MQQHTSTNGLDRCWGCSDKEFWKERFGEARGEADERVRKWDEDLDREDGVDDDDIDLHKEKEKSYRGKVKFKSEEDSDTTTKSNSNSNFNRFQNFDERFAPFYKAIPESYRPRLAFIRNLNLVGDYSVELSSGFDIPSLTHPGEFLSHMAVDAAARLEKEHLVEEVLERTTSNLIRLGVSLPLGRGGSTSEGSEETSDASDQPILTATPPASTCSFYIGERVVALSPLLSNKEALATIPAGSIGIVKSVETEDVEVLLPVSLGGGGGDGSS